MKNTLIIIIILILVVTVALYFGKSDSNSNKQSEKDMGTMVTLDGSMLLAGDSVIFVADQPEGNSVMISKAFFANNGFVVVHRSVDGSPGEIVGSSGLIKAGEDGNILISLKQPSLEGDKYFAMLHFDNGDSKFNASDDLAVIEDGIVVQMEFTINNDSSLPDEIFL